MKLINTIYLENGNAKNAIIDAVSLATNYSNSGADELVIVDCSTTDIEHDTNIGAIKKIADAIDIPMIIGGNVKRLEDIKKYLYAGAKMAILDLDNSSNVQLVKEASERFGAEKIAINMSGNTDINIYNTAKESGVTIVVATTIDLINKIDLPVLLLEDFSSLDSIPTGNIYGINVDTLTEKVSSTELKYELKAKGFEVNAFKSAVDFSNFKLNEDGMIPVVVQDYKTNDVLMLAYMNEEAFNSTLKTGRMTYYSRSRKELWEKGLTSGHFQYVKSLSLDCDSDTILAKVYQVGAACHTGSRNCFFTELIKKEYDDTNPLKVFENVYDVILDRKTNPKEGSYTNYLFDKGIDKILKKVGEEATEIIIAAKNPDPEEIKYEISDFLYHVMVLMAERGVSWEEITTELARR